MRPEAVVIHIAVGSLKSVDNSFLSASHGTSAHYCVGKDGSVHQYVREEDTAFHAGIVDRPVWRLIKKGAGVSPNSYTVGIEHEGMPDDPWTDVMYAASAELTAAICARWAIPIDADHLPMHREIRAGKSCPGFQFDPQKYLELVSGVPATTLTSIPAPSISPVTLMRNTRIRDGQPSTSAPTVQVLLKGASVSVMGFTTQGELISGNPNWYLLPGGNYLWAGGTDVPEPHA
jgi:hypothetical protein